MTETTAEIASLTPELLAETLKNLLITLQHDWGQHLADDAVVAELRGVPLEGGADELRARIVAQEQDRKEFERWGKALLAYLASYEELRPYVDEAIEDARSASTMDIIVPSLLILGAVVVLLKWRPKKFVLEPNGRMQIDWEENDVSVVADLAKAAGSIAGVSR